MRYVVRKSIVRIVGNIWMPATVCAQTRELSSYDVGNIRGYAALRQDLAENDPLVLITREDVEQWLMGNSGDFQSVIDFEASIEDGDKTLDFAFATEDGEMAYTDAVSDSYGDED
jgi:hypothetical protein